MRWRLIATTVIGTVLSAALVCAGAFAVATLLTPTAATVTVPKGTFLSDAPQAAPSPQPFAESRPLPPAETPPAEDFVASFPPVAPPVAAPERPARSGPARPSGGDTAAAPRPPRRAAAPAPEPAEPADGLPGGPRARPVPAPERPTAEPPPRVAALRPPAARPVEPPAQNIFTPGEIRRLRLSLRLTPEQEIHWPPVEEALLQVGTQQAALARQGQDPSAAFTSDISMRVLWAARPLIGTLREDQKAQIRLRARMMGFGSVASYL